MNSMRLKFTRSVLLICFYLFLYLPIIVLIVHSFNKALFPAKWEGATLHWYKNLYYRNDLWRALYNSTIIAVASAVITIAFCITCTAYTFFYNRFRWFSYGLYSIIFIPEIVLAIALLIFFMATSCTFGFTTLIIAHTVLSIGYAFPIIYQRWSCIDRRLIEAAYDLGATRTQAFTTVVLPLLMPTLAGTALLIFILSFDDFLLAYFCGSFDIQTLPLLLLSMLRMGIAPEFNALAALMFAACSVGVMLYYGIMRLITSEPEEIA